MGDREGIGSQNSRPTAHQVLCYDDKLRSFLCNKIPCLENCRVRVHLITISDVKESLVGCTEDTLFDIVVP